MFRSGFIFLSFLFCILLVTGIATKAFTQCISSFPYTENFEESGGGWTYGGDNSDWTWGTPSKFRIESAGEGLKCWIAGGLTGYLYNENERSWLQSKCFDFTNIKLPYISFLCNWDTEYDNDGAALQYSDDDGLTWKSVGNYGDKEDCLNENWYDANAIKYGVQQNGWSGASGYWLTLRHTMPYLSGKKNVSFRFVFGSGKVLNNYNGFAVDNIRIDEAPLNDELSFEYHCLADKTAIFTSVLSPCITDLKWDFGDPKSGTENNADGSQTITHLFSLSGTFTVTLSGKNSNNNHNLSKQIQFVIPDVSARIVTPVSCHGENGMVEAIVKGEGTGITYLWNNTPPATTQTVTGKADAYYVSVHVTNGCQNSATIILPEPSAIQSSITSVKPDCKNQNGSVSIQTSGGSAPYSFTWSPAVSTTSEAKNLSSGNYSIIITDKNSCTEKVDYILPPSDSLIKTTTDIKQPLCSGSNGTIQVNASGGESPYQYQWIPAVSHTTTATNISAGNYKIQVTDKKGCVGDVSVQLVSLPSPINHTITIQQPDCGESNGSVQINTNGGIAPYQFAWLETNNNDSEANNLSQGTYTILIKDNNDCKDTVHAILAEKLLHVDIGKDTVLCKGETLDLYAAGDFASYVWNDGSTLPTKKIDKEGNYSVEVTNAGGCKASDAIHIYLGCTDLVFPSGFTPNGDLLNDLFGPTGHFSSIKSYRLFIYNRYGYMVYQSTNPYQRWNGFTPNGQKLTGTYTYFASYEYDGEKKIQKGTLTLIL